MDERWPLPEGWQEPTKEQVVQAFNRYCIKQDEAEEAWLSTCEEVLTPAQFDVFTSHMPKGSMYFASLLMKHYLKLSAKQVSEFEVSADRLYVAIEKTKERILKERLQKTDSSADGKPFDSVFMTDQTLRRLQYEPFSRLSPIQFEKAVRLSFMKKGESLEEFLERTRQRSDAFREVLEPLIVKAIEEKSQK